MVKKQYRKPHRYAKRKSILPGRFILLGILALIVAGGIFYSLFLLETFWVEKIIITGEEKVPKEDIEFLIEGRFENKALFFKTKSIFAVDIGQIKEDILNMFPQIAEVKVSRSFFDAVKIEVTERVGLALWCQDENCFLIDREGVIFEKASEDTELIRVESVNTINDLFLGLSVVDKEKLSYVFDIKTKLDEVVDISIDRAVLVSNERINIRTLEGWEIYFNTEGRLDSQITGLNLILEKQISPKKRGELEYIDLRFSRVYYK